MAVFPRWGSRQPRAMFVEHPQILEQFTKVDVDRLSSMGTRELGRFRGRSPRGTPGQNYLGGASPFEDEFTRLNEYVDAIYRMPT